MSSPTGVERPEGEPCLVPELPLLLILARCHGPKRLTQRVSELRTSHHLEYNMGSLGETREINFLPSQAPRPADKNWFAPRVANDG